MKKLINPLAYYPEKILLAVAVIATSLGIGLAYWFDTPHNGIMQIGLGAYPLAVHTVLILVNSLLLTTLLFVTGKFINTRTRFIDMLNAVLLSRIPLYLSSPLAGSRIMKAFAEKAENISAMAMEDGGLALLKETGWVVPVSLVLLVLFVIFIVLLFNGFRTAVYARNWKHYLSFALTLLVADLISRVINALILNQI